MALKHLLQRVDDLDGSSAEERVRFSLDGIEYEIDLSGENAQNLRSILDRYVPAARRVSGKKVHTPLVPPPRRKVTAADRRRWQQIRAWAQENGFRLARRGRLPAKVVTAYHEHDSHDFPESA